MVVGTILVGEFASFCNSFVPGSFHITWALALINNGIKLISDSNRLINDISRLIDPYSAN